ncbi:MAG: HEAT repeat domain-containing protein [Gammaproteobacteria bacterium]|nr:HEAT repeat domain-containing protein [Gammaproteobacteria bacterium]
MSAKPGIFKRIIGQLTGQYPTLSEDAVQTDDTSEAVLQPKTSKPQRSDELVVSGEIHKIKEFAYNKDGRMRHDALNKLAALNDPETLPILYARANDWVPEIRNKAISAIVDLTTKQNAAIFVKYLPNLYHLKKCTRWKHDGLVADIENYLMEQDNVIHLLDGISSKDQKLAKACFRLVIDNELAPVEDFVLNGLKHNHQRIRIKCSHLLKDLEDDLRQKALDIAIRDRNVAVRREAFMQSIKSWGSEPLAKEKLFDPHHSIREIATLHLGKSGSDVQYTYLRHLNDEDPKTLRYAIWGIGFLKGKECVQLIKPFLEHENASVRHQAKITLESLSNAPERFLDTVEWNSIDTFY